MKKFLILLSILWSSCSPDYEITYYFPDRETGVYFIIFNAKNGMRTQVKSNKYDFRFNRSKVILTNEPQLVGTSYTHFYYIDANRMIKREIFYNKKEKPNLGEIVVSVYTINGYTSVANGKEVDYEMIVLAKYNPQATDSEWVEINKEISFQMDLLHEKIDSLVHAGEL